MDDLEIWLDGWELVCVTENYNKKYWVTKTTDFLHGDPLNFVFEIKFGNHNLRLRLRKPPFFVSATELTAFDAVSVNLFLIKKKKKKLSKNILPICNPF